MPSNMLFTDGEQDTSNRLPRLRTSRSCRRYPSGLSSSDAEVEYRRGRSMREGRGNISRHWGGNRHWKGKQLKYVTCVSGSFVWWELFITDPSCFCSASQFCLISSLWLLNVPFAPYAANTDVELPKLLYIIESMMTCNPGESLCYHGS